VTGLAARQGAVGALAAAEVELAGLELPVLPDFA
jgi:hypothetical protein